MSSSSDLPAPNQKVRRSPGVAGIVRPSVMMGAVILCTAIVIAAIGTVDPLWWHLHFSRLGTFADASGYTFNLGVVLSGLVIAATGVPLAVYLASAMSAGRVADPRAARMLPPLLVALGASLALIGVIPLTLNEFLHDRAANGVLLSFLGLVVVSRRTLPELPAFLARYAVVAVVLLSVGIALMVTGILNLAAFEVIAFGSMLSWVHLLERSVRRLGASPSPRDATPAASDSVVESRRRADTVRRGAHRRMPASVTASRTRPAPVHRAVRTSPARRMTRGRGRIYPTMRRWRAARSRRQI